MQTRLQWNADMSIKKWRQKSSVKCRHVFSEMDTRSRCPFERPETTCYRFSSVQFSLVQVHFTSLQFTSIPDCIKMLQKARTWTALIKGWRSVSLVILSYWHQQKMQPRSFNFFLIIMKNFNRRDSHGHHGSKRRELAQHAHSHGSHAFTHAFTSTQLQPWYQFQNSA